MDPYKQAHRQKVGNGEEIAIANQIVLAKSAR